MSSDVGRDDPLVALLLGVVSFSARVRSLVEAGSPVEGDLGEGGSGSGSSTADAYFLLGVLSVGGQLERVLAEWASAGPAEAPLPTSAPVTRGSLLR